MYGYQPHPAFLGSPAMHRRTTVDCTTIGTKEFTDRQKSMPLAIFVKTSLETAKIAVIRFFERKASDIYPNKISYVSRTAQK